MPNAHQIGEAVKFARFSAGLERKDLAIASGVSVEMLAKIEQGKKRPSATTLKLIATATNTTPMHILTMALKVPA